MATGSMTAPARPRSTPSVVRRRRGRRRKRFGDLPVAMTFLAPAIVAAVLLRLWPTARALWDGLHSTPLGVAPSHWTGLDQFTRLFSDLTFINALKITALFGIIINPLQIAVALGLATLFNER